MGLTFINQINLRLGSAHHQRRLPAGLALEWVYAESYGLASQPRLGSAHRQRRLPAGYASRSLVAHQKLRLEIIDEF